MLKLYRFSGLEKEYWETWEEEPRGHVVHWGALGTEGKSKTVKSSLFRNAEKSIQKEIDELIEQSFVPVLLEDHAILMVEYSIDNMGSEADLDKRHRLENFLNEKLGWTGLGACDGGSIGSGTMEVCNFVVDFEIAKRVIEESLLGTEFADYSRIYDENAE